MKIGINGLFLLKPHTGIGRYTRDLFLEAARNHPDSRFVFVVPDVPPAPYRWGFENVEITVLPELGRGPAGFKKTFWEQVQVPRYFKKINADLVHFPYPCNPWFKSPFPTVVTVHDTIPWTLPEYRKSLLTRLYQDRCKNAVKKADKVLCVSEWAKKEVAEVCKTNAEKITVIYNAVTESFTQKIPEDEKKAVLKKYGLDSKNPFFLYVGGYDARKNVKKMVKVFLTEIAPEFAVDFVLAGGKCLESKLYESYDELTKLINDTSIKSEKGKMAVTGFIDESDLPVLYQSALAFLNLSKKEGFNLPLLEACASGLPAIVSDLPVHHEVAGETAVYCHPDDEKCLQIHMKELLKDSAYYLKQKQKAESFVNNFSWKSSAEKLIWVYKSLL